MKATIEKLTKRDEVYSSKDYLILYINKNSTSADSNYRITVEDFLQGVTITPPPAIATWGNITGTITNQTDLVNYINSLAVVTNVSQLVNDVGYLTSVDWSIITNKPSIPAPQIQSSWVQNNPASLDYIIGKPTISAVGLSNNYNDLSNLPILFDGNYNSLTNRPSLATVATTGSYNDLLNLPVVSSQIQVDFAQTDNLAIDFVKNKQQEYTITNQTTVTLNHNLNRYVQTLCINDSDNRITVPEVIQANKNTVTITFSVSFTGKIVLS